MKKHFPAGTFVATPLRVLAILQLCVVFTYLVWAGGYPFLGELYELKVARLKYESVIEDERFIDLSEGKRLEIQKGYEEIKSRAKDPFTYKIEKSMRILLRGIPFYMQIWVLLSIILPIFILLRIEGAIPCALLLPLLVGLGFYSSLNRPFELSSEEKLFPTEAQLVGSYIGKPLEGGLLEQKEQLQGAWNRYLGDHWEGSQFLFNIARLEAVRKDGFEQRDRGGSGLWLLALVWNFCWALGVVYWNATRYAGSKGLC